MHAFLPAEEQKQSDADRVALNVKWLVHKCRFMLVDGHHRLAALHDLQKEGTQFYFIGKFVLVTIIIIEVFGSSTSPPRSLWPIT